MAGNIQVKPDSGSQCKSCVGLKRRAARDSCATVNGDFGRLRRPDQNLRKWSNPPVSPVGKTRSDQVSENLPLGGHFARRGAGAIENQARIRKSPEIAGQAEPVIEIVRKINAAAIELNDAICNRARHAS